MARAQKKSRSTDALTVNGVDGLVQDVREGIRQGLQDVRKGRVREARAFFREFELRQGLKPCPLVTKPFQGDFSAAFEVVP